MSTTGSSARRLLLPAGVASLAAGALHVGAVAVHAEHRSAVLLFTGLALTQLTWGVVAIARPGRPVAGIGVVIGVAALGGWVLAVTTGLNGIDGLDEAHPAGPSDTVAAGLATASAVLAGLSALDTDWVARLARSGLIVVVTLVLSIAAIPAVASLDAHDHAAVSADGGDHDHDQGHDEDPADLTAHDDDATSGDHQQGGTPAVPPKSYDPELPIDLGGVEGVTLRQQARAENLVAITLDRLPQYADVQTAIENGYSSIGDAMTGHEHYMKRAYLSDEHLLNPDYPESLVYEVDGAERTLVSAMFMLDEDQTFDDVPDVGGSLTQWHVHADLCFSEVGDAIRLAGVSGVGFDCGAGTVKFEVPMIHVWITPHRCGPFAALDGVGAGQPPEGEETACDHAHGG